LGEEVFALSGRHTGKQERGRHTLACEVGQNLPGAKRRRKRKLTLASVAARRCELDAVRAMASQGAGRRHIRACLRREKQAGCLKRRIPQGASIRDEQNRRPNQT